MPLPDVPTDVSRAGDWTLQRLAQEVAPPPEAGAEAVGAAVGRHVGREVILETQSTPSTSRCSAGGGDEVGQWAARQRLPAHARRPRGARLLRRPQPGVHGRQVRRLARRGPGPGRRRQHADHGTIPTDDPWVPLRILGLGLDDDRTVEADVFLLTDEEPDLLAGGTGLTVERSEPAATCCSTTCGPTWAWSGCPRSMWLSYLTLDAAGRRARLRPGRVDQPGATPSLVDAGVAARRPCRCCRRPTAPAWPSPSRRRRGGGAGRRLVAGCRGRGRGRHGAVRGSRRDGGRRAGRRRAGRPSAGRRRPPARPARSGRRTTGRPRPPASPAAGGGGRPSRGRRRAVGPAAFDGHRR